MPADPGSTPRPTDIAATIVPDAPDERDLFWDDDHAVTVPDAVAPDEYQRLVGVTWHQRGEECTGFALAAIANYLIRRHVDDPGLPSVSRRMLYESAQLHDDEDFEEGSTLRGALKGWHRTGVALDDLWPYDPDDEHGQKHGALTLGRLLDARHRPLVSYRRILHADVDRMRRALAAGHVLFAAAHIHVGWYRLFLPDAPSRIERRADDDEKGGHAFVIVGYDADGFWVHNSWGPEWGTEGYALLPYDEWSVDGHDTWVVDLDPGTLGRLDDDDDAPDGPDAEEIAAYRDLWPHLVVLRDDGALVADGLYEMDEGSFGTMMYLFGERTADWSRRRLAVVVDDGRDPAPSVIERCRALRDRYMDAEIYPIFVVWATSWGVELVDELDRWTRYLAARPGANDPSDLDDPIVDAAVRASVARPIWRQLASRSRLAAAPGGGAHTLAAAITKKRTKIDFDLHVITNGVGDLLQCELLGALPGPVATATVAASATPLDRARTLYGAALGSGQLAQLVIVDEPSGGGALRLGSIETSLLDVIGELLAPGHGSVELLGQADDPGLPGSVTRRIGDAADLHGQGIVDMLAHDGPPRAARVEPTAPPTAPVPDDLPLDPLARAEAMRRRSG